MAITATDLRGYSGLDKEYIATLILLQLDIQAELNGLTDDVYTYVAEHSRAGEIQKPTELGSKIIEGLAKFWAGYMVITRDASSTVAEQKVAQAQKNALPLLRDAGLSQSATAYQKQLKGYVDTVNKTFNQRQYTTATPSFQQRITTIKDGSEKIVRAIIQNGVRDGLSSAQIAKKLEQYINPINDKTVVRNTNNRPQAALQKKLEDALNSGNAKEAAKIRQQLGDKGLGNVSMDTKVREEFIKAMKAGKPISLAEAEKRALGGKTITKGKPYDEYRSKFGRSTKSPVKGVPEGTVQYNARRIARSETAETYRRATDDLYRGKQFVKGWAWLLSSSHRHADECDDKAAADYGPKDQRPQTHPQCLCDWVPLLYSLEELAKNVAEGIAVDVEG